jgi:site-specific DNA-methyltransferase (adenine-specific)
MDKINFSILHGNCLDLFDTLDNNSIDTCITDPPYFIDGMGKDWDKDNLDTKTKKAGIVGSLPIGMKFDPKQGIEFQNFMLDISKQVYRVLKPGAFYVSFSQARLYHRMAIAVEEAGFEIRDMLGWTYEGQAKAFSQDHFVRKMNITDIEKNNIIVSMNNRKTPQLKPMIEPMVLAQKPKEGTFVENWMKWGVGLIDTSQSLDGKFPGNLMAVAKPRKSEKGETNDHLTVKPTKLIAHLTKLLTTEGQVVFDPFMGSGSHGVAALECKRKFIGFEIEKKYFDISNERLIYVSQEKTNNIIIRI